MQYLELLGCIEMYILDNQTSTFWSTYKQPKKGIAKTIFLIFQVVHPFHLFLSLEKASELDSIDEILIEVQTDALIKMAQFIGEKKYNVDFI